ncbi:dephospho-CoA kinase [Aquimarina sp. W85]|uniref:dephospho-CoA kinase n=1 Tax=Aquimarina rhodophyticola TaxID=3342246 RepID=UPI0036734184
MKIVGLTGGIGSGKSTVAKMFENLGVPVYIADIEAKKIMHKDASVKHQVISLLGVNAYLDDSLNTGYIASKVFENKELLTKLNAIVHPAVALDFENWKKKQKTNYIIKEVAILFEKGAQKDCDYTILVTAPKKLRIQRILDRDRTTVEEIEQRMNNQWEDSKKIPLADFIITNVALKEVEKQVLELHQKFML